MSPPRLRFAIPGFLNGIVLFGVAGWFSACSPANSATQSAASAATGSAPTPAPPTPANANGELLVNGGFEFPAAPPDSRPIIGDPPANRMTGAHTNIIGHIAAGTEPPGFGWKVENGNVDVVAEGYDSGGGNRFEGKMAEGRQHLDLDGNMAGAISQTIPTKIGVTYVLTFAYANNPDPDAGPSHLFQAEVTVVDAVNGANLIPPQTVSHAGSTLTDYHWNRTAPLVFTASSEHTTIRFTSQDEPSSIHGLLLDDASVKPSK